MIRPRASGVPEPGTAVFNFMCSGSLVRNITAHYFLLSGSVTTLDLRW